MSVNFYEEAEDSLLKYAVIIAMHNGNYVFCKHKERETLEVPGDTAKRTKKLRIRRKGN